MAGLIIVLVLGLAIIEGLEQDGANKSSDLASDMDSRSNAMDELQRAQFCS